MSGDTLRERVADAIFEAAYGQELPESADHFAAAALEAVGYADESQYAIIHVGTLGGDAWPIVERVPGGWQSGAHHYPDDVVLDVQPLNLRDYLRAEGLAEWQRKVADALGVSEGPGPGYPWHCADADEAARYASEAVHAALDLAEMEIES